MARKPRTAELLDESKFERKTIEVEYFRRKSDGNLFFKDPGDGQVLDWFIQVVDTGQGFPVVRRRRARRKLFGFARRILRGAFRFLSDNNIPLGVVTELLSRKPKARGVIEAIELAETDKSAAVRKLIETLGPDDWAKVVNRWLDDPRTMAREELLRKLREL